MATPHTAVKRYYFTLFMLPAVVVTYFGIWLDGQGISESRIGLINAVPMLIMLLSSIFVGRLADKASDWKVAIVIGNVVALVFCFGLFGAHGFWMILLFWTLQAVPSGLVGPVADAATIRLGQRLGFGFGPVRGWGTVGYMLMCVVAGYLIGWKGEGIFLWLLVAMSALRALNSVLLPKMRAPREVETAVPTGAILSTKLRSSLGLWVLLPLIGGALIFSTHMVMNTFSAIVWKNQGISAGTIGALIAVGAAAEAAVMFSWARLQNWFGARQLVLIASFAACIRWLIMAASPPVWLLFPLQLMQGVTFTFSYLGCLYFIANRTDESVSAEAQSLFGVMQQGASVLAVLSFGLLFDYVGVHAFGGVALLSAGVAGLIIWSLKIMPSGVGQD